MVTTDRLIEELWGESPPSGGVKTLHYHVSKLVTSLSGRSVAAQRHRYPTGRLRPRHRP
jgi:DNA-binding SARP family transcriptional activator